MKKSTSIILFIFFVSVKSNIASATEEISEAGFLGDAFGETTMTATATQQEYEVLKKLVSKIQKKPSEILEYMIGYINGSYLQLAKDTFEVRLNYRKQSDSKPIVEFQFPQFSIDDQFTFDMIVDERVKTNEFFKLHALVELNSFFPLFNYEAVDLIKKHHSQMKKKKQNTHSPFFDLNSDYTELYMSTQKSLGLTNNHYASRPIFNEVNYMEMIANARAGSVYSQKLVSDYQVYNTNVFTDSIQSYIGIKNLTESEKKSQLIEYAKANGLQLDQTTPYEQLKLGLVDHLKISAKQKNEKLILSAQQKYKEDLKKYKSYSEIRKNIVQNYNLSELVLNNDRAKVAEILQQMFPWDLMEPTEKFFWSNFILAIRQPDYSKSEILYRGVDEEEKMQLRIGKDFQIQSAALFSKRLTAGSGSHLFKLLGLPETFEKFGTSENIIAKKPFIEPHSLTSMMLNHANNPNGSPFISLSYSPTVAYNFATGSIFTIKSKSTIDKEVAKYKATNASGGFVAVRIDPRRLIVNSISGFEGELEVLASLLIFPDEIVHLEKGVNFDLNIKKDPAVIAQEKLKSDYVYEYETVDSEKYQMSLDKILAKVESISHQMYPTLSSKNKTNNSEADKEKKFQQGLTVIQKMYSTVYPPNYKICSDVFR